MESFGYTRNNLSIQQAALQPRNEAPIWEMGVIPFDSVEEAIQKEEGIKCRFGVFLARGEWFYATHRIIQYIADYAAQHISLFADNPPRPAEDSARPLFGEQLRARREFEGITQADLVRIIGCSRGYIAFIEKGGGMPGQANLEALTCLCSEFDVSTRETSAPETED